MQKKVYPNDPCPCGSGKKYKHCCKLIEKKKKYKESLEKFCTSLEESGKKVTYITLNDGGFDIPSKEEITFNYNLSEEPEVEFVKHRLNEDLFYLYFLMNFLLSDNIHVSDYKYLEKCIPIGKLEEVLEEDVENDGFHVKRAYRKILEGQSPDKQRVLMPYNSYNIKKSLDLMTLYRDNNITIYQVLAFHKYLMKHVRERFNDYRYIPASKDIKGNVPGLNQHRGFDFLIAIIINLEIQLGIPVLLEEQFVHDHIMPPSGKELFFIALENTISPDLFEKVHYGTKILIKSYESVLEEIGETYDPHGELLAVYKQGHMTKSECNERLLVIEHEKTQDSRYYYDYIAALKCLCIAKLCGGLVERELCDHALNLCSQMDYIKTLYGMHFAYELFQNNENFEENYIVSLYHQTVFYLIDEKNGLAHGRYPTELCYEDTIDVQKDSLEQTHNTFYLKNPAIRETYFWGHNYFRLEIFEFLQGCYIPFMRVQELYGAYPIIPFFAKTTDQILHCKKEGDLWTSPLRQKEQFGYCIEDFELRQSCLNLEWTMEEVPSTCLKEYLNPSVFYDWMAKKQFYRTIQEQNQTLKKQIDMNRDLISNIAHSAGNYLNPRRLSKTGIVLHEADCDNPTVEELHSDGLLLMLQSEQEKYLVRQLDDIVQKYQYELSEEEKSAKKAYLEDKIRSSISKTKGLKIEEVLEFALKTILARVLFRNDDKGKFIRQKMNKTDEEWTYITSLFITDVLAVNDENSAMKWWNNNFPKIEVKVSDIWREIRVLKEGGFYDLISEILVELMINALSYGKTDGEITLEFGQVNDEKNRPIGAFIMTKNETEALCAHKPGVGLSSLNSKILLLNSDGKAIERKNESNVFITKVWIEKKYMVAK